jgi:hypothetical protein
MSNNMITDINNYFSSFEQYGFVKKSEKINNKVFEVVFRSKELIIRLEKYRREIYVYIANSSAPDEEVNLFTLLEYLNRNTGKHIKSNYFPNIENDDECYRLQIKWIVDAVTSNFNEINNFILSPDFKQKIDEVRLYIKEKYPDLFLIK